MRLNLRTRQLMIVGLALLVVFGAATFAARAAQPAATTALQPPRVAGLGLNYSTAFDASAAFVQSGSSLDIITPDGQTSLDTSPVRITVRVNNQAHGFRALLNRRDITARFTRLSNTACLFTVCEWVAEITPSDGLLVGLNDLRVFSNRGLLRESAQQTFTFAGSATADAGADRKHLVGETVRLDGTGSQPLAQPGGGLLHQWVLVSRPVGSQAALNNPSSPTPQFVADKPGTYIAQLTVHNGLQASAPDLVSISAHETLPLIPLEGTQVQTGGQCAAFYAIKVNGTLYPGSASACGGSINVVTFTRDTFDLVEHFTADTSTTQGMNQLIAFLNRILDRNQERRDLIVVMATSSSAGLGNPVSQIAPQLEQLGATTEFRGLGNIALSFVGARGLRKGEAYQMGSGANFTGYFVQDSHKNYAFAKFESLPYLVKSSTTLQGATITIGDQTYTPDRQLDSSQLGGFHVVVVDRADPTGAPLLNKTYLTSNNLNGPGDRSVMYDDLSTLWNNEAVLVFVNSFGQPFAYHDRFSRLIARRLHMLGGTYDLIQGLPATATYALVGAGSVNSAALPELSLYQGPEASTWLLDSTVLRGALSRGRRGNWYSPVMAGNDENLDPALYTIVGQATQSWSFPSNAEEQAAYNWISQKICSTCTGDLRATYANTNISISTLHDNLNNLNYPNDSTLGFGSAAFGNVKQKWLQEMTAVINIRLFQGNLTELWIAQQSNIGLLLTKIEQEVKDAVKPKPESITDQIFDKLIDGVIEEAENVVSEVTGIPVGVFQGVLNITKLLAKTPEGPSATEQIESKVANLAGDAVTGFNQQLAALGSLFEVIYQDPGKIAALGQKLTSGSDQWAWQGTTTTAQLLEVFERSARISYYQSLLATVATVQNMVADYGSTPAGWCRYNVINSCTHPYSKVPQEAYSISLSWEEGENLFHQTGPHSLIPFLEPNEGLAINRTLLQHLYAPVSQGGLGVPQPYVLRRWSFKHQYCTGQYYQDSRCGLDQPQMAEELGPSGLGQP